MTNVFRTAIRYHDISCGHRVAGHENKCAMLHGHNYRIWFHAAGSLDSLGRVIDFGVLKSTLCEWLEKHWDHKFLAWDQDSVMVAVERALQKTDLVLGQHALSICWLPMNPTAENLATFLLTIVGPDLLRGTGVTLTKVVVEETRKCSAAVTLA